MKTTLPLFTVVTAVASSLLIADDKGPAPPSINFPVIRIEVAAALKQYEKVKSLLMDAQLDRELQNADSKTPKDTIAALDTRIEILSRELTKLRAFANHALKVARENVVVQRRTAEQLRTDNIVDRFIDNPDSQPGTVEPPGLAQGDPAAQAAHLAAFLELQEYRVAKARYLTAKNHFEKLVSLCQ